MNITELFLASTQYAEEQLRSKEPNPNKIVDTLLTLAQQVEHMLDSCCEENGIFTVNEEDVEAVSLSLDILDDKPGYTLTAAGKAQWALQKCLQ